MAIRVSPGTLQYGLRLTIAGVPAFEVEYPNFRKGSKTVRVLLVFVARPIPPY